ncbi:DUF2339 domain-containing protein [Paenibacillus sp. FSL P2-0121]|uniref:DUF2339 domain-containing protein n=1 Tax=Paenibacillus sp. FSL P2-0121 TaxID=2921626 RepID=UPI0030D54800
MESFKDRLRFMKVQQDGLIKEYEALIAEYESHDLVNENEYLKKQYEKHKLALVELKTQVGKLQEENTELRVALTEQILDEKLGILKVSRQKLQTYFASRSHAHTDRLTAFEVETKRHIQQLYHTASRQLGEEQAEISSRLGALAAELNERVLAQRQRLRGAELRLNSGMDNGLHDFASEEISEEVLKRRRKQNQIEMKIGLSWINKLGILLLILAVGAGFRYTYSNWFTGYMKGSAFFLLGLLMLGGGEWLYRKGKGTFALGLLGGGISVLYGSIFYSYFLLDIISIYVGLSLSVLVTLTAVLLSLRYESRSICALGLIGGYLPLYSYLGAFGLSGNAVYVAMGYLFLLNLFILLISFRKRWNVVNYISYLFNTPSMLILIALSDSNGINMCYAVLTFAMYLGITLWYPFKYRSKLSWWDFSLLGCNTFISCLTLYILFMDAGLKDYNGALALLFCLLYLGLGRGLEKLMPQEKESMLLFYATSLTFGILMIPFQFGAAWWSIGWLIEGVVLTLYGNLNRFKGMERAGWGIMMLCLVVFFCLNVPTQWVADYQWTNFRDVYFPLKYVFITAGMLIVAVLYAVQHNRKDALQRSEPYEITLALWFKYAALLNFWIYGLYESGRLYHLVVPEDFAHRTFYNLLLSAVWTLVLAYVLPKVKVLYDTIVKYFVRLLFGIGYVICIVITVGLPSLQNNFAQNTAADYIALAVLIIFNIFVWFSGRDLLIAALNRQFKSMEIYPVFMAIYLLGIITAFLGVQLQLSDAGLIFSLIYLLLAVLFIMYGFRKRYVYIRRFGLGLTLLATGKLLLYDLGLLNTGSKIIAYASFGICLLGISYLYQKVSNRMEEGQTTTDNGNGTKG